MDDDLRRELERVGERFDFGEYEIEAYLTVLEHGRLSASEIADRTSIPQPRVYDTVRSLAELGFLELQETRPMQALAVEPEEAFAEARESLDDLVDGLSARYREPARDAEAVTLVKSRATILRYVEDAVEDAEYELLLSVTPDLLGRLEDLLAEKREAGVTVELLVAPAADVPSPDEFDYGAVATVARARRGVTTPVVAVADGRRSVFTTPEALRGDGGRDRYGVVFDRSELGFLVSGFLSTAVWTSAEPLVEAADGRPFPRRYATIRRCVEELDGEEGPLYARIEGRDVLSGERRVVEGEVVEVRVGSGRETASLVVETGDGTVEVGGQVAALEDIEAHEITVDRGGVP